MKSFLLVALVFTSCGDNRNDQMTKLINQKKVIEDSVKTCQYLESSFLSKAKAEMNASRDSLKWHPLVDSSTTYYMSGHRLKNKLKEVDFSIDSLSKMK